MGSVNHIARLKIRTRSELIDEFIKVVVYKEDCIMGLAGYKLLKEKFPAAFRLGYAKLGENGLYYIEDETNVTNEGPVLSPLGCIVIPVTDHKTWKRKGKGFSQVDMVHTIQTYYDKQMGLK